MPILFADPVSKVIAVAHAGTSFSFEFTRSAATVGGKDENMRFRSNEGYQCFFNGILWIVGIYQRQILVMFPSSLQTDVL